MHSPRLYTRRALLIGTLASLGLASPSAAAPNTPRADDPPPIVRRYAQLVRHVNRRVRPKTAIALAWWGLHYATRFKLDRRLYFAVVWTESAFDGKAISPAGAVGYGQVMPDSAADVGADAFSPLHNLWATGKLLADHYQAFRTWSLALAAYNAGPAAVRRHAGIPPYKETRVFIRRVLARHALLSARHDW